MTLSKGRMIITDFQNERKKKTGTGTAAMSRTLLRLRYWYQCFLLHFVLGVTATAVLFMSGIAFVSAVERDIPEMVRDCAAYSLYVLPAGGMPKPGSAEGREALSRAVWNAAFYSPDGQTDALFRTDAPLPAEPVPTAETGDGTSLHPAAAALLPEEEDAGSRAPELRVTRESLYTYDPAPPAAGTVSVVPRDLSQAANKTEENAGILFSDQTEFHPDGAAFLARDYPIPAMETAALPDAFPVFAEAEEEEPLVLIIHTHGTEAYAPDGARTVEEGFAARSQDPEENVVAVGDVLAERLTAAGIPVLHCGTMFDLPSYPAAYSASAAYVKRTVAEHPSIAYVFDVHRDALTDASGRILRPVTAVNGECAAQVMLVVGTDEAGADHHGWRDNLTVAVHLQDKLNALEPTFARPINLRSAGFNAQYAKGSLLLEIGSSGNSLTEAKTAAYYLGGALAALIRGE